MFDGKAFGEQMVEVVKSYVDEVTRPLLDRIDAQERELQDLRKRGPEKGEPGRDGRDGSDGKDAEPVSEAQIAAAVEAYLATNPPAAGRDGVDGKDGEPGADGEKGLDGKAGSDGVGLAGAMIGRDGDLVITLTSGEVKSLGPVVGRDGKDGDRGEAGFSLDDFGVSLKEDGRTLELSFSRGEAAFVRELALPTMIYRGIYREGQAYEKGDTVTYAGSLWHCNGGEAGGEWAGQTKEKPGDGAKSWTLAAKRGRDGKDFAGPQDRAPEKVRI